MCETLEWFLSLNGLGILGILVLMIVVGLVIGIGIASENQDAIDHRKNYQIRALFEEAVPIPGTFEEVKQRLEDILKG